MTITVARTYVRTITPEVAGAWLEMYRYDRQRTLRQHKVETYAQMMTAGFWTVGSPMALALNHSSIALIDGQHRLAAVAKAGVPQTFSVTEFQCETSEEIDDLYAKHDRGMSRSPSDALVALRIPELLGLTKTQINKTNAALQLMRNDFRRLTSGRQTLEDEVREDFFLYGDAIKAYMEATAGAPTKMVSPLNRAAVIAVGIATFHHSVSVYGEQPIVEFWKGVALDDGLYRTDPRKVAHEHIASTRMSNTQSRGSVVGPNYQARYIANCFNAWTEGREFKTSATKVPDSSAPIKINGTPWKG